MSETAHDLRSPLTTVRESIRLIRDGDLGAASVDQRVYLTSAMDQCDCMFQMIGEMLQLERLRTGTPRVDRSWVTISEVRKSIDETLRPWALPRKIEVLWDIMLDCETMVYADPAMLRRLVVNLATNAIRVTPENGVVLVQLQRSRGSGAIRWSVIDRGCGIKRKDLQRIAERGVSTGGGEGLGLLISRQLASLHFSDLEISSRFGKGTDVSFETASGGPRGVALAWSRWRLGRRRPLQKPRYRDGNLQRFDQADRVAEKRVESPVMAVTLSHEASMPRCVNRIAAGTVSLGATVSRAIADDFDHVFQRQQRMFDFIYRVETRRWVWAFDVDPESFPIRLESIENELMNQIPETRTTWSSPQIIPVDSRITHSRLSDLLVRSTLAASTLSNVHDQDAVRLGTLPIGDSNVAAGRLENELRRLTERFQSESRVLAQQVKNLCTKT